MKPSSSAVVVLLFSIVFAMAAMEAEAGERRRTSLAAEALEILQPLERLRKSSVDATGGGGRRRRTSSVSLAAEALEQLQQAAGRRRSSVSLAAGALEKMQAAGRRSSVYTGVHATGALPQMTAEEGTAEEGTAEEGTAEAAGGVKEEDEEDDQVDEDQVFDEDQVEAAAEAAAALVQQDSERKRAAERVSIIDSGIISVDLYGQEAWISDFKDTMSSLNLPSEAAGPAEARLSEDMLLIDLRSALRDPNKLALLKLKIGIEKERRQMENPEFSQEEDRRIMERIAEGIKAEEFEAQKKQQQEQKLDELRIRMAQFLAQSQVAPQLEQLEQKLEQKLEQLELELGESEPAELGETAELGESEPAELGESEPAELGEKQLGEIAAEVKRTAESRWIAAGISCLAIFFIAAIALVFCNLERQRRTSSKKASFSKANNWQRLY